MNRKKFIQLSALGTACVGLAPSVSGSSAIGASDTKSTGAGDEKKYPRNRLYFPQFDFGTHVFSKCGSWLIFDLAERGQSHRVRIKTLRSTAISYKWDSYWAPDLYDIVLMADNQEVKYDVLASPYQLQLKSDRGLVNITFSDNETVFFETRGVELRLVPLQGLAWTYQVSPDELKLNLSSARMVSHLKGFAGTTLSPSSKNRIGEKGESKDVIESIQFRGNVNISFALRITQSDTLWDNPVTNYAQSLQDTRSEIDSWMAKMPPVPEKFFATAQTAWYLLHSFQVAPAGRITRQTVLASKNSWLTKIWSWDHCFHAMALAHGDAKLAWDQLFVMFDNQHSNGAFPDALDDIGGHFNFVKPPVHGWAIRQIIETTGIDASAPFIREAYEPLAKWTDYWYTYRDINKNGMCHYLHGNDSGWDNATAFDQGIPTEGADLAAYLVLQQETLAWMAHHVGKPSEGAKWSRRAEEQYQNLLKYSVANNKFYSPLQSTGKAADCQSLINYVPLILGKRVPAAICETIIPDLKPGGPFLSEYGLATEALTSSKYQYDGYWRGPIWAPPSYQIFKGLLELGEVELANTIAERFCTMCMHDPSFSENYDAKTGQGLQAPGVCWTPAVFMLFAEHLGRLSNKPMQ